MNTAPSVSQWQPLTETAAASSVEEDAMQERRVRFWLWMVLGLCVLALVGILGGYAFGNGIMRGSHLREHFATGQSDEVTQPPRFGIHEQGTNLLGRPAGQVRYYSGPSELAMAASRGEVVIDDKGVVHEVEQERVAVMEAALNEQALALEMVSDTLPPLPPMPTSGGLLPSDVAPVTPMHPQAVSEEVAVAVVPAGREPTAGTGRSQREDIFFGQ